MDVDIIRQSDKSRLLELNKNHAISKRKHQNLINDTKYIFSESLISNSKRFCTESQANTILCSHETIDIEFNVSSGSAWTKGLSSNNDYDRNVTQEEGIIYTPKDSEGECKSKTIEQLLSMDDSLFENVDLSEHSTFCNKETKGVHKEHHTQKNNSYINSLGESKGINNNSPDMFISNDEEHEDPQDLEDIAWDMSISVKENNNKSVCDNNKNSDCENELLIPSSLSNIVLSSWESPIKSKTSGSFEGLLKRTLENNAYKVYVQQASSVSSCSSLGSKKQDSAAEHFFGLPILVKRLIKRFKGIEKLYEWQEECLSLPAITKRKNLVYALPTSGGKTLVAEVLVFKEILCREKNVLFVLPYVSIAQEKVRAFSPFAVELGFIVEEYAGSKGTYPPQKRRRKHSVYVATIEKALGLVHSLIECQRIQELGLIVIDELHLIGEPKRGANLESMLVKLIHISYDIQIVGMSATIGNLSEIATFLHADVYTRQFRPVELSEYVKVGDELFKVCYSATGDSPLVFHSKLIFEASQKVHHDPDNIGELVKEVTPEHSCLVFCPSKKNCENVAVLVSNSFDKNTVAHKTEEKKALYRALLSEGNGRVCSILRKTLPFGVAYHHSGLTTAERSLLEEAFLAKTVCCICCTSTLAAGVNLPARRVILRSPYIGTKLLNLSRYKQMVGRAGRTGMGDVGESFLLCKPDEANKVEKLLSSSMDLCESQLQGVGLEGLVISSVDLSLASSMESVLALCRSTLLYVQSAKVGVDIDSEVLTTIDRLVDAGALTKIGDQLTLSKIGKASVKGNVDIEEAKRLYADLVTAQDSLVLLSHLHLLYLVTPYNMMEQIPFQQQPFCNAYMNLETKEVQAATVIGIGEQCIAPLMAGRLLKGALNPTLHRFYLSLILFDLWKETSIWTVANKYNLPRGLVHNLLTASSAFSSSVVRFCEVLDDLWCFKLLLAEMALRLTHCCNLELIPLMDLPAVKIGRAKQLYNAGFKTLNILAKTEPKALAQAVDHMPKRVAHQIVAAAKLLILAKAESLQEEAEAVLEGL